MRELAIEEVREVFDRGSGTEEVLRALMDCADASTRFLPVSFIHSKIAASGLTREQTYDALHWLAGLEAPFLTETFKFAPDDADEVELSVEEAYRAMAEGRLFHPNGEEYDDFAGALFPFFCPTDRLLQIVAEEGEST